MYSLRNTDRSDIDFVYLLLLIFDNKFIFLIIYETIDAPNWWKKRVYSYDRSASTLVVEDSVAVSKLTSRSIGWLKNHRKYYQIYNPFIKNVTAKMRWSDTQNNLYTSSCRSRFVLVRSISSVVSAVSAVAIMCRNCNLKKLDIRYSNLLVKTFYLIPSPM